MSLAGPVSNLAVVLCAGLLIRIGILFGGFEIPHSIRYSHVVGAAGEGMWAGLAMLVSMFFSLNLILAVLNIIPLPPLDGSGAITLLMPDDKARGFRRFARQPGFAWIGIIVAWHLFGPVFSPIFHVAIGLLYPGERYR